MREVEVGIEPHRGRGVSVKKKGKNGILESLEVQQAKNWCIK